MIGLLGKKVGMSQVFDKEGRQTPITVVEVGPCFVTGVRTKDKDGYSAVQLGFQSVKEKKLNKAQLGFFKKSQIPAVDFVREIRTSDTEGFQVGQVLHVDNFEEGEFIDVEGISIGKGFQGVVKRHGFKGGGKSHGSMFGRVPGSIGASSFPSRVVKGMRAAGHMGNAKVTMQNLQIVKVDKENHLLAIKGSVPGFEGGYLMIRTSLKRGKAKKWKLPSAAQEQAPQASPREEENPKKEAPEGSEKQS